ncbi:MULTISPECIES: hypothetical protein [Methylobacteriaceae]|uniref:hypothetical protein n=1 Tax=Methylobacteriaceae TaxID=119045 RepID=UPI000CDA9D59|nr:MULTISPECIES: hypothetical protein [Methylobacteriaceae]MCP1549449.1 hypothetical protein [Methylorubrum zatmanii]MCP1553938.1 hypothetical protein [Methylorubrum extorquens]MCP1579751.1 hypothetical protein [Methylorubrum extorquens]POR40996.1 hypothetical protein CRT23_21125 [Methylobacterium sp. V23]
MAAALSQATGRSVRGPQISHWIAEIRPVPEWVEAALLTVLNARISELLANAGELRKVANGLERRAAARIAADAELVPDAEPEPEENNAPSMGM